MAAKKAKKPREFWVSIFEDELSGVEECHDLRAHKTAKAAEEFAVDLHREFSCDEYFPRIFIGKVELQHEVIPPSPEAYTVKPL